MDRLGERNVLPSPTSRGINLRLPPSGNSLSTDAQNHPCSWIQGPEWNISNQHQHLHPKYGKCFSPIILQDNLDTAYKCPPDSCKWCQLHKSCDVDAIYNIKRHPLFSVHGFSNSVDAILTSTEILPVKETQTFRDLLCEAESPLPPAYLTDFSQSALRVDSFHHQSSICRSQGCADPECMNDRVRKHQCRFCDFSCSNRGQLKGHIRVHTGEKPFKCEACEKSFARNEELTRHKRIHSGFKPYSCQLCEKKFGRKDHLNKHMKTHLNTSEKKVHACGIDGCDQKYTRSDALARHQWSSHGIKPKYSKLKFEHF